MNPNYEMYCDFLMYLKKNCELIKIEDSVEMITKKIQVNGCFISFTYDDGFEECHSLIAPALEEFNINAAFFIIGKFINGNDSFQEDFANNILEVKHKRPMNWSEIKNLSERGHIVGSHTLGHINMNCQDFDLVNFQLSENKRLIEKYISQPCDYFAFPFGQFSHFNDKTLSIAEKYHKYIFSATDYKHYFSFDGRVINRRHIESDWPKSYINFFLSVKRKY